MPEDEVISFEKASAIAKHPFNAILGNGFSIELFGDRFNYKNLKDHLISQKKLEEFTINAFNNLNTSDFEYVMRLMDEASKGLGIFHPNFSSERQQLTKAVKNLRDSLCYVVSSMHPETQSEMNSFTWDPVIKFLLNFSHIFTTNYDLALYWGIMKANEHRRDSKKPEWFKDGFGLNLHDSTTNLWGYYADKQNVHYLHGALHLFHGKGGIVKIKSNNSDNLNSKIKARVEANEYPIFISEGTSEEKLSRILDDGNAYLGRCYDYLCRAEGSIFTFGISFQNDVHLLKAIEKSKITQIFVGIRDQTSALLHKRDEFERITGKKVTFYLTSSVALRTTFQEYFAGLGDIWNFDPTDKS